VTVRRFAAAIGIAALSTLNKEPSTAPAFALLFPSG